MKKKSLPKYVQDLTPDPRNPRRIADQARLGLQASMDTFGDLSGLVFNVRTGHLVCGHQRRDNLPPTAPIIDFKEQSDDNGTVAYGSIVVDGRRWPVRFVDWDRNKEAAANIAANNRHIAGEFTNDVTDLLKEIELNSPDLYDQTLLHKVLEDVEGEPSDKAEQEEAEYDLSPLLYESYNYVVVLFKNDIDWAHAQNHFDLKKMRDPGNKKNVGVGHVIDGAKYLKKVMPQ
jgi:hypothetical protein